MAKDIGIVLLSFLVGLGDNTEYYNPTPVDEVGDRIVPGRRKHSEGLEFIQPLAVSVM